MSNPDHYENSPDPGYVRRYFKISLRNIGESPVSSVALKWRECEIGSGKIIWESDPIILRDFVDRIFPNHGSLLPHDTTDYVPLLYFDEPGRNWRQDSFGYFFLVAARPGSQSADWNEFGKWDSAFQHLSDEETIARIALSPKILKATGEYGTTPLHWALARRGPKVVNYMLSHGSSWKEVTKSKTTALHFAAMNPHLDVLALALAHGGDVGAKTERALTPLWKAVSNDNLGGAKWLLEHGSDPNSEDLFGYTPATSAIANCSTPMLQLLIDAGANKNHHNPEGAGWMQVADEWPQMFDFLLKSGLKVDECDQRTGLTALMYAEKYGEVGGVPWLLSHGADPFLKDRQGMTALDYSKQSNTLQSDKFLRADIEKYSPAKFKHR